MTSVASISQPYSRKLDQLNLASINKFYLPYSDIDWDSEENRIDVNDDVWGEAQDIFIGQSDWYQQLPQEDKNRFGLQMSINTARLGLVFENILTRGLLTVAKQLPSGSPEYRYVMHEAIEECHHSMMFQEFVNRSGLTPGEEDWLAKWFGGSVVWLASIFPELFFIFVLGGEAPIDYTQRESLKNGDKLPPILKKIMHIHTTEEARHINFAEHYLREHVPQLNPVKKFALSVEAPVTLAIMANMMMKPSSAMIQQFNIPKEALRQAYDENPIYPEMVKNAFKDVVDLCKELGLVNQYSEWLWRRIY